MKREFTASVYLIDNQKVLLIYHHKLQKWLSPGGHVEINETPVETARREVKEETGLDIEFFPLDPIWINCWNAKSLERPYLCLLEEIPAYGEMPAHQHIDFVFVAKPVEGQSAFSCCQWFGWEDLQRLEPDIEIFKETLQVIWHLLHDFYQNKLAAIS